MTVVRNTNGEKIVLLEEQEEIIEKARFCKLDGFAEELQYQFINPLQYKDSTYESRISGCLDSQISANKNAQFNAYFKKSHMPRKYYLSKYQDDPERNLNRKDIQYLKELNYINAGTNIIINGPTGTGKTALALATGMEAIKHGYPVMYYRMSDLIIIMENKEAQPFARFRDSLKKYRILIIDDYGLEILSEQAVLRLNDIVDSRYGMGTIIITTQLKVQSLHTAIPKTCIVRDALLDRLFRPSDKAITLTGKSWRGDTHEFKGDNT